MHPQYEQDAQWAAVSRATQLEAAYRTELRHQRAGRRRRRLRMRAALWLVRVGMRLAGPLTLDRAFGSN